ncbi:TetR family transcriptional regulator [Nocardia sp. NEAU-G5]|uniref:TetR family transcriptional regulator n=1 Tax=Nocardia albiluteola TaxID=2842303 RepID=A0ABS6BC42_9NOCA|nr:TetR/AcrR family transcriptional regulator [Nocardia albiluteola]MBU3066778.1 TetR family transcriptional regulator [Nocardia albiluteola]
MSARPATRAEQRSATQARILRAARALFAEAGYESTTIRAIATEANTDPGLVMRYFGSKANLFAQVAGLERDGEVGGTPEQAAEQLLAVLESKLVEQPMDALAAIRSMFTHPQAADDVRVAMTAVQRQAAAHMADTDADLRAGLIGAITLGAVIGRHLLQLDGLRDADPERITALLRRAFHDVVHGAPEGAAEYEDAQGVSGE